MIRHLIKVKGQEDHMASTKEYLDFIMGQLEDLDEISCRAMMGEYI